MNSHTARAAARPRSDRTPAGRSPPRRSPSPLELEPAASSRGRLGELLAWAAVAVGYLALVLRFDFVCDDAFIAFRYARNVAAGHGFVFVPGNEHPVEGFSSFLWVSVLGLLSKTGVAIPILARIGSALCGLALLGLVAAFLRRRLQLTAPVAVAAVAALATLPPFFIWTTGGLETIPAALTLFVLYERLLGDPERPRGWQAGVAALACALVRVEGIGFAVVVLGLGALRLPSLPSATRARLRSALVRSTGVLLVGFGLFLLWRYTTYGDLVSNTTRTKADFSVARIGRGIDYVTTLALVTPLVPLVLVAGLPLLAKRRWRAVDAYALVAANVAFVVYVGGDFMTFHRFFVPTVAFVAILLAIVLAPLRPGPVGAACAIAVAVALGAPPAFGVHATPRSWRVAANHRWTRRYDTEREVWEKQKEGAQEWAAEGRELARIADPDDTIIAGAVGALGYYSGLEIIDPFCLVTRGDPALVIERTKSDAGHDRILSYSALLEREPTYQGVVSAPVGSPPHTNLPHNWAAVCAGMVEVESYEPTEPWFIERELEFRVLRMVRWDWVAEDVVQLTEVARGIDPASPDAESELTHRLDPTSEEGQALAARLAPLANDDRLVWIGEPPFEAASILASCYHSRGFAIAAARQSGPAPELHAARGRIYFSIPLSGEPRVDGREPGWRVVAPGETHGLNVDGGLALVIALVPSWEE